MSVLFQHANMFDGENDVLHEDMDVLVEGERITEVSDVRLSSNTSEVVDLRGQTLMPGLIDAHVHVYASELNLTSNTKRPWTYLAQYANGFLGHMLANGYTSIRDMGGADYGLSEAIKAGLVVGPRLFTASGCFRKPADTPIGGRSLKMTQRWRFATADQSTKNWRWSPTALTMW